jgi:hypothetical protein
MGFARGGDDYVSESLCRKYNSRCRRVLSLFFGAAFT